MRLIDADTLKAEFTGNFQEKWHYTGIRAIIDIAPTIEAEPVRHGRWTEHPWADEVNGQLISNYECSVCKDWSVEDYNYCPHCGAKMSKEEK